jgi:hypothetical protein
MAHDLILERALEGKCPLCLKGLNFVKKTVEEVEKTIQIVDYKGVPIMVCKQHPTPKL